MNSIDYYHEENKNALASYQESLTTIRGIYQKTKKTVLYKNSYNKFFNRLAEFVIQISELEKRLTDEYFGNLSFEELKEENMKLYQEFLFDYYIQSYSNPQFAVKIFGDKKGQLLSAFYCKYNNYISLAFSHKIFVMEKYNRLFIEMYNYLMKHKLNHEKIKNILEEFELGNIEKGYEIYVKETYDKEFSFYTDIIMTSDLKDLRYLFKYGDYITDNEIKTASFLLNYPNQKLKKLTDSIVNAYIGGFIRENKDITKRSNVQISFNIGQERLVKEIIKGLKEHNLIGYVTEVNSTDINKQYEYDHKFDNAIYMSNRYVELSNNLFKKVAKKYENILKDYSGIILIEKFGEEPFSPQNCKERLKLSEEQQKLMQALRIQIRETIETYLPNTETSFSIVAFPTPEIGEDFEKIFIDIIDVNMLDSKKYEVIQQVIINVLDKGEYVHVKGKGTNQTDIKVKLYKLKNPEKETNFTNCVADVNIPVGEVFTTPVLKDTNGVLHIEETYLGDFNYQDLKLIFKDGYVEDYICNNFEDEKANKEYIKENLLFPYSTLPIGEFAIGTNTLAYAVAEKYNILNKLPILIIEKMGPHFAIGDTCFSWVEEIPVYNVLDNKEIVSRDNERSILRKKNLNEAYTNRHTDITLPYKSLSFIKVICSDGKCYEIIKDGKFVLDGTEELNIPLEELYSK